MTLYKSIEFTSPRPHVAQVTLNRPQCANALSPKLFAELQDAIQRISKDPEIHVWIVTGAPRTDGRGWFSAGADLKEFSAQPADSGNVDPAAVINQIDDMLKPSIAAIDGLCTTGGLELALACDIRIAAATADFSDWHLRNLGSGIGGWGLATRLARLVGTDKAKELILTGASVSGDEAERIGLANRVVQATDLMETTYAMAETIASRRPDGVRLTMGFLTNQADMSKYEALHWAAQVSDVMNISRRFPEVVDRNLKSPKD